MPSAVPGGALRTPSKRSRRRRPGQRESASTANPEPIAVLRKYLPESSKIFEEMPEELI